MKKFFITLLSIICVGCLGAAIGCTNHTHTWSATDDTDSDGNVIYVCEDCGETHTHTYSSKYTYDSTGHWYAATCSATDGCSSAKKGYSEHVYDEDGTTCTVCNYDSTASATYNLEFSYYQYDENGDIVMDSTESYYVEVGVTYTAVETSFGLVDIENGDTVQVGDVISFTVKKSVYCYYTDSNEYPVANVNDEQITYDSTTGVYTFTVASDMATDDGNLIVWVSNVLTRSSTIDGSGTEDDPWTINNVTDWLYFASRLNDKDYYGISWNIGYWVLTDDLDFEGEEIYVIGNAYTSTYSLFMGNFDGQNHTISNFLLTNAVSESTGEYSNYLGIFGVCSAYSGVSAVIQNLNVENFTVEATAPSDGACVVGTIVGYGMGFNLINCAVDGCTMTITGNDSYYSYGGGLIGILQSYLDEDNEVAYYSSIQYCSVNDVEITCTGIIYAAGGIAGYVSPYAESAPVYIINDYSSDVTITGAVRVGGIAGTIARYTSVQNCYSTATLSANATLTTVYDDFKGTQLDDTIAYAGGIVGYAENDTVIAGCFFVGNVAATSSSGSYQTGYLYGGYAAAGYESYYSSALITWNNLHDNDTKITSSAVTEAALENIGWQSVDWIFSGTYPAINSTTGALTYTITINIDGSVYDTVTVDSTATSNVYVSMSYRYLLYDLSLTDSSYTGGISIYICDTSNTNLRTYGFYFDEACTQRIPTGYVITGNMTVYAKYADCSDILDKEYYVTGNGTTATIIFYANGVYSYEEGVIYLTGTYEYDGTTITFKDGYFSRVADTTETSDSTTVTVSDNQRATYYTFYAEINEEGNLEIYDCDSIYIDTYSTTYDYLARFYAKDSSPLVAVYAGNVTFAGKYYAENGYEYVFNINYTGTYTDSDGITSSITYSVSGDNTLSVTIGRQTWTATLSDDNSVIVSISRNDTTYILTAYDDFEGTWTVSGLTEKIYTFDGVGNWTYMDATLDETLEGTYTIDNGVLTLTRGGMEYAITINSDGTLNVNCNTDYDVTLYAENSIAGVWYTYALSLPPRYTLILYGINSDGWGEAVYEDTTGFRYIVNDITTDTDNNVVSVEYYVYYGDTLYAYLEYDVKTGILEGQFYDSDTEAYDLYYTFYMYDEFYGTWVGSSSEFATVEFNGLSYYSVDGSESSLEVSGLVTITGTAGTSSSVAYTIDITTGAASFTYNGVAYTIAYDAFTNTITVTYADGTVILAEKDEFADIVFETTDGTTSYSFDGRGYLDGGGVVTITTSGVETTATYTIDVDGVITIDDGTNTYTITCGTYGYEVSGTALYVQNSFTGTWAIFGYYAQITIGDIRFVYEGTDIEIAGTYYDGTTTEAITLYYNGEQMWFEKDGVTYYVTALARGLVMSTTETYTDDKNYGYMASPDSVFGTWTDKDGATLTFDGTSGGSYRKYGEVTYTSADGLTTYTGRYEYYDDQYVVYYNGTYYYYTFKSSAETYAYTDGTSYLVAVVTEDTSTDTSASTDGDTSSAG